MMSFARMKITDLPDVQRIENEAYPYPWTTTNFLDSIDSGYECWILREISGVAAAYFVMMLAVDEAHLLNIAVRPDLQGLGVGRSVLDKVAGIARERQMESILLEVRPSNSRALAVYERYGFRQIGLRKGYYPAANVREDAIVMRLVL